MKRLLLAAAALSLLAGPALAQSGAPIKFLSAASTNSTLVKTGRMSLFSLAASNSTATPYFLKLYDKATAPTCGTDVPRWTIVVPPIANGGLASPALFGGLNFTLGLGFCLTGLIADNDTTVAATGVAINLGAAGR